MLLGQARMVADGLGSAHRCRAAAVTALTGFQSAMARKTAGMCPVRTRALETNATA